MQGGVVGIDCKQQMLVFLVEMEVFLVKEYVQVLVEVKSKGLFNCNVVQVQCVCIIVNCLILQIGVFCLDVLKWNWEVNVLILDEINVWCMLGGKIVVYIGLIDKFKIIDDELVVVMGYEIVYVLCEYVCECVLQQVVVNFVIFIGVVLLGLGDVGKQGG